MQAFYQFHNPVKLQDDGFVDEVLQYYVGWEEELMAKLVSQYGPEPNMEARIEKKRAPPALDGSGPNPSDEQYASAAAFPDGGAKRKTGPTHDPDNVEENRTAQAVSSSAVAPPLPSALPSQLAMETAQSNTTAAPTPPLRRNRSARIKSNLSTRGTTHLLQYDLEDIDIYQRDHNMQVTLKVCHRDFFQFSQCPHLPYELHSSNTPLKPCPQFQPTLSGIRRDSRSFWNSLAAFGRGECPTK